LEAAVAKHFGLLNFSNPRNPPAPLNLLLFLFNRGAKKNNDNKESLTPINAETKSSLIDICDYAIWRNAIWRNVKSRNRYL